MSDQSRDQRVANAFVKIADRLTDNFDIIDLLHTLIDESVDLLDVDAGGLLIADENGQLQLVASTSEKAQLVEIIQLGAGMGPCVEAFTTGAAVVVDDIAVDGDQWPDFREGALTQGFHAVFATPMRLRGTVIGAMNLFSTKVGGPTEHDAVVAQALADIATIGILHERSIRETHVLNEQLQRALESRVLIEQAKGVLSASGSLDMDQAFATLRNYARSNNLTLRDVAQQVAARSLDGILDPAESSSASKPRPTP